MARSPLQPTLTLIPSCAGDRPWGSGAPATALAAQAERLRPKAQALRSRAAALESRAARALAGIPAAAPEVQRWPGWAQQDCAASMRGEADRLELERERLLFEALTHEPGLVEASAALAALYREQHARAEAEGDTAEVERAAFRLRAQVQRLPPTHPSRASHLAWLDGKGSLTLRTDRAAEAILYRYEARNRQLVPEQVRHLGRTPLRGVVLPRGSYLLCLRAPDVGGRPIHYPFTLERRARWDGVPPCADGEPAPVHLPGRGALGPGEVYVPAGWANLGGDPGACLGLPRTRVWLDGFAIQRFPVTNRQYLIFLNDLVATGQGRAARLFQPGEPAARGVRGRGLYEEDPEGRYRLRIDPGGASVQPDWPVVMVDWRSARAYAAWAAGRTGLGWRLPAELEWEKAARGVDGRIYPWGDQLDASRAHIGSSHRGTPMPAPVNSCPVDESPYGMRGAVGNTRDWCADRFQVEGPRIRGGRVVVEADDGDPEVARALRGGGWSSADHLCRPAGRFGQPGDFRSGSLGFRLARSLS